MKIEKIYEEIIYNEIEKVFTLSVKGMNIRVSKWIKNNNLRGDYESNEIIIDTSYYKKLSEEEKEEFDDFILDLDL